MHYLSIFSTIISVAFTCAVFLRYRRKGGMHLFLWGIGLALYALGTMMEALLLFTFSDLALRLWYLSGAMLTAAWLGQGSVNLLVRKRGVTRVLNGILLAGSLLALGLVLAAPVNAAAAARYDVHAPASAQYGEILSRNGWVVFLTIFLNIYGTITLVGGAIYSAFLFWRKKVLANRMTGNLLIAAGALMPAMGGTFIKAGLPDWLYLSELLGAILMFAGFIQATASQPVRQAPPVL